MLSGFRPIIYIYHGMNNLSLSTYEYLHIATLVTCFVHRYGFLLPLNFATRQDTLSTCVAILHQFRVPPDMYQVGYTKLFFRAGQVTFHSLNHSTVLVEKLDANCLVAQVVYISVANISQMLISVFKFWHLGCVPMVVGNPCPRTKEERLVKIPVSQQCNLMLVCMQYLHSILV